MKKIIFLLVLPLLLLSGCATQESSKIAYGEKYINPTYGPFSNVILEDTFVFRKDGTVTITLKNTVDPEKYDTTVLKYITSGNTTIIPVGAENLRCEINDKFMIYYYSKAASPKRDFYICINENHLLEPDIIGDAYAPTDN